TRDLFDYMRATMPPNVPSLAPDQYLAITSFILASNGAAPGDQALTAQTAASIGAIASGTPTVAAPNKTAPAQAVAPPVNRAITTLQGPTGLTVTGDVKGFTPVTDEMLRNQDPGDWLMARRNYQGWSYSPLTQVTRDNVHDLQLAWVWTMNDGGANEPTPIVHNGIVYLTNTANVIQALDGKTGELIWEHRIPPYALIGPATMRTIATYQP